MHRGQRCFGRPDCNHRDGLWREPHRKGHSTARAESKTKRQRIGSEEFCDSVSTWESFALHTKIITLVLSEQNLIKTSIFLDKCKKSRPSTSSLRPHLDKSEATRFPTKRAPEPGATQGSDVTNSDGGKSATGWGFPSAQEATKGGDTRSRKMNPEKCL